MRYGGSLLVVEIESVRIASLSKAYTRWKICIERSDLTLKRPLERCDQPTIPIHRVSHSVGVSTHFNSGQFKFMAQDRELDDDWTPPTDSLRIRKSHASSAYGLTMQCRTSRKS